ncbi:MAG: hypothetical protein DHS20C17_20200 [Cyclobacteriaceae bacterium]|nr:MAG: hypothetical protein DHS20C17_20200 [Cyclobacteriaceae bacterium]
MMTEVKNYLVSLYKFVVNSIAFLPGLISVGFIALAMGSLALENHGVTEYLINRASYLVINNEDTARTVLSTLVGGLISLMVFSFSMVMILLSQASSDYSPRLLPGLISNKRHQVVLGIYLGTILFNIFIIISILPDAGAYELPGFSALLAIVLGIICLLLFVYFIHSISNEIQVSHILKKIFKQTKTRLFYLEQFERRHSKEEIPMTSEWNEIAGNISGYFQGITKDALVEIAMSADTVIQVVPINGIFVLEGSPVLRSQHQLNEEVLKEVMSCLQYSDGELVTENYLYGFKQITEIAIKAMSPGINDPGTAINAIDYLTDLLATRMKLDDSETYKDQTGTVRVIVNTVNFQDLIYNIMASLRQYCKHDVVVVQKLINMLKLLLITEKEKEIYPSTIMEQLNVLMEDAKRSISNQKDQEKLNHLVASIDPSI